MEIRTDCKGFLTLGEGTIQANTMLREWDDICNILHLKHFLLWGVVIGLVNNGKFVDDDCDIDVGVVGTKSEIWKLRQTLLANGFGLGVAGRNQLASMNFHKYNVRLDVYYEFIPSMLPFLVNLEPIEYDGRTYCVPSPVEKYLDKMYGKFIDWRIPITAEEYFKIRGPDI